METTPPSIASVPARTGSAASSAPRPTRRGRPWDALLRVLSGAHALALVDQAAVSAASFATTVMIGRGTDSSQLGIYTIAISVVASAYTIQGSLFTLPYTIQRHRPIGTPAEHAGSTLAQCGLLWAFAAALLAAIATALPAFGVRTELAALTWALAGAMPFALFREFGRRFAFTHLQMTRVLMLDAAVAVTQIGLLAWLAWIGRLSAVTACTALGASCGLAALGWFYIARTGFVVRFDQLRANAKETWRLGKWLFINQLLVQLQRYSTYWLTVVIAGAAVTGVFAACMSIVSFSNPLVFGLSNILAPKSVLAWKESGGTGLRRRAGRDALVLAAAVTPFCLLVLWIGDDLMQLLYHGAAYNGHGHTIALLAFATLASALGLPASNALASMERPRAVFFVSAVGALLTVGLVWRLLTGAGLVGAASGLLIGNSAASLGLWIAFLALVPRTSDTEPALRLLRSLRPDSGTGRWEIARLGEGDHSTVYAVRSTDHRPIWRSHGSLVLKLYKPEAALDRDMVEEQFNSLARLHAALNGRTVNGWTVSSPLPLHVSESPLAMIMTAVPATKDLKSCAAADDELTPATLEALGRTLTATLQDAWTRGQMHGDLALQNILYDVRMKTLSFIDPGTRVCCVVCNDVAAPWSPAVLELGHIVRDLGTDVRDIIGYPIARLRRQVFVESALTAYLETIALPAAKRRVLGEVRACAQAHLARILTPSWSPRGLWHGVLNAIVLRRIDSLLDELEARLVRGERSRSAADPDLSAARSSGSAKAADFANRIPDDRDRRDAFETHSAV